MSKAVPHLGAILEEAARGALAPPIALMRLLEESATPQQARDALDVSLGASSEERATRLGAVARLWAENPGAWDVVKAVLGDLDHGVVVTTPEEAVARWAELFDRGVRISPEGSVALYSFGNPELLAAQTAEVVDWMRGRHLVGPEREVLEIGCGIGRFCLALAPLAKQVVGLDISREMIETAHRRCAAFDNVDLRQTEGHDLGAFQDGSFDLVLAADSFPYLVDAGGDLAGRHVQEAARVLRPGGDLLILNFSYRGDRAVDAADVTRLAADAGLAQAASGDQPFQLWDGTVFHLRRP